jgi:hypothetical protein
MIILNGIGVMAVLKRLFAGPAHTLSLSNRSLATWKFELVSGGTFRIPAGTLHFHLQDPDTGRRRFAGSLSGSGDAIFLKAGKTYQVDIYPFRKRILRFFRLVDSHGQGQNLRFFMGAEGDARLTVRLYDGVLQPDAEARAFRQAGPGQLEIARNRW